MGPSTYSPRFHKGKNLLFTFGTVNGQLYIQSIKTVFIYVNVMCVCVLFGEKE